jgi:hypothetical protein
VGARDGPRADRVARRGAAQGAVGWLVGRAFPVADDLPALQIASDWTTLFCLIDNHIENIRGPALSHVYLSGLLKVFRDGAAPLIADPFAQAFRDLRERMIEVGVPTWIERFGEQLERLFDLRRRGQVPRARGRPRAQALPQDARGQRRPVLRLSPRRADRRHRPARRSREHPT